MAMAKFVLKTLPGIDRPAIASLLPTLRGESVMLDLGANIQCDAENLVQFAVMGEVFARHVLHIDKPSIGILFDMIRMLGALIAKPAIDRFRTRFDPRRYNGAMFLGLGGICVKSHGGTDGLGFFYAIKVAHELVVDNLNEGIKEDYARFSSEHHIILDPTAAAD